MKKTSSGSCPKGSAHVLSEAELIAVMDKMTPKLKHCVGYEGHECDSTFNLDDWAALTDTKKEYVRKRLDWYVKPKILADGRTGYTVNNRCNKCKYQHENLTKFRGGGSRNKDRRGHTGPVDKAERLFFCRVKPCIL